MIRNRLGALIGERGLKITRVAKETGISRNTITATVQNDSEMIRLDTINTLCKYLNVTPCDFFDFEPLDIDFSIYVNNVDCDFGTNSEFGGDWYGMSIKKVDIDIVMGIEKEETINFDLTCELIEEVNFQLFDSSKPFKMKINFDNEMEEEKFSNIYKKINSAFYQDIYKNLSFSLENSLVSYLIKEIDNYNLTIHDKTQYEKDIPDWVQVDLLSDVFKKI